jgi:RimJ/RimL family protein N-acetyltransferase
MTAARRIVVPSDELGASPVVLEPPGPGDVDVITELCQDPAIQEWTTVPAPYERSHAVEFLDSVEQGWADGGTLTWAIREDGEIAGLIGLGLHPARSAEIGYWLAPAARGRGVMARAVSAVVAHAFDPDGLDLDRLSWQAFAGNLASRRVAERAGFAVEGLVRGHGLQRGVRRDAWIGTLLRAETAPGVEGSSLMA